MRHLPDFGLSSVCFVVNVFCYCKKITDALIGFDHVITSSITPILVVYHQTARKVTHAMEAKPVWAGHCTSALECVPIGPDGEIS